MLRHVISLFSLFMSLSVAPLVAQQSMNTSLAGTLVLGIFDAVYVTENTAFIGRGSALQLIDVTDPTSPTALGQVTTPGYVEDVFVVGNYAYVADAAGGLRIID